MTHPWISGQAYELFMGRWSTLIAQKFLDWLTIPPHQNWLDVGCGTGSLTRLIWENYQPKNIVAVDSSGELIAFAKQLIPHGGVDFRIGLAQSLEFGPDAMDVVVSGLVLNFVPRPEEAISEMVRVTKPGGKVGIFLWDYADGMEMLRYFWDAAVELYPEAQALDEGNRFPLCREGQLESLVQTAGLKEVEAMPIDITTVFPTFEDYWAPFLGNVGPAPVYVMSLNQKEREMLKEKLRQSLPVDDHGSLTLKARAWAVKSVKG